MKNFFKKVLLQLRRKRKNYEEESEPIRRKAPFFFGKSLFPANKNKNILLGVWKVFEVWPVAGLQSITCRVFNCRSTCAKPAVRRSPQQRTPQVNQAGIRTVKTIKRTHELKLHHVLINLLI